MNDGKPARPRWWHRPQRRPPAEGTPLGDPHGPGPARDARPASPPAGPAGGTAAPDGDRSGGRGPVGPGRPSASAPPSGGSGASGDHDGPGGPNGPGGPGGAGAAGPGRRVPSRLLAAGALIALVAGGIGGVSGALLAPGETHTDVSLPQAPAAATDRGPGTLAGIARATLPGVVYIHVKSGGEEATGTGIILDTAGHILTNNHVVQPAASSGSVRVTFNGGSTAPASIVGRDTGYDLAVIKVGGGPGLRPLTLGNSSAVRVGDPVIAIGAPFDLEGTVTSGIVSAKDRAITAAGDTGGPSEVSYVDAIQTDAPINPGNSGGPLMNNKGQVIGINSAIRSADTDSGAEGGSIGLGFAIPVNQARRVAQQLINTGHAVHPVVGVTVDMRYQGDGARIAEKGTGGHPAVTPGGPGAAAGLRPGDVITAIDGVPVHSGQEFIVRTRSHQPGQRVRLTVRRGGRNVRVDLVLGSSSSG